MYFYNTKLNKYEQAQLLEMCNIAFIFDGNSYHDVKQILNKNKIKCEQAICSHFFIAIFLAQKISINYN